MAVRTRLYDSMLREHFARHRQMALVSGPRQVGKTTTCRALGSSYLNWDSTDDRRVVLRGPNEVARHLGLEQLREQAPFVVFDELHKYSKWKRFLKGFFDIYGPRVKTESLFLSRLRRSVCPGVSSNAPL